MNKLQMLALLVALLAGWVLIGAVQAQTSTSYDLTWHVGGSGGGEMSSTSYAVRGTVGQAIAGYASSASYALYEGYWEPVRYLLYLPLAMSEYT